jgi:hypothetical protein
VGSLTQLMCHIHADCARYVGCRLILGLWTISFYVSDVLLEAGLQIQKKLIVHNRPTPNISCTISMNMAH